MTAQGVLAEFGERLRAKRRELKISPDEFAEKVGFGSGNAVLFLESGGTYPTADALVKMSAAFKIDIHELLTGEPGPAAVIELEALREMKRNFRQVLLAVIEETAKVHTMGRSIERINKLIDMEIGKIEKQQKRKGRQNNAKKTECKEDAECKTGRKLTQGTE